MIELSKIIDLMGNKYERLTVIGFKGIIKHKAVWICRCDCGNIVEVSSQHLRRGTTKSCGCYAKEVIRKRSLKHGASTERLFSIWRHMIGRCTNEKEAGYKHYGGRGIKVCSEWLQYENFKKWALTNEYEETLTIDRINVNGNYEPDNCRWATMREQGWNKRDSVKIEYQGELKTLEELSEITGIPQGTLRTRHWKGVKVPELLDKFNSSSKYIEINGKSKPVKEWARLYGINVSTMWTRLRKGIVGEKLIEQPYGRGD